MFEAEVTRAILALTLISAKVPSLCLVRNSSVNCQVAIDYSSSVATEIDPLLPLVILVVLFLIVFLIGSENLASFSLTSLLGAADGGTVGGATANLSLAGSGSGGRFITFLASFGVIIPPPTREIR